LARKKNARRSPIRRGRRIVNARQWELAHPKLVLIQLDVKDGPVARVINRVQQTGTGNGATSVLPNHRIDFRCELGLLNPQAFARGVQAHWHVLAAVLRPSLAEHVKHPFEWLGLNRESHAANFSNDKDALIWGEDLRREIHEPGIR
jgi:hypothetical protein